ncbi:prosalusin-like isoform X2 [Maylandia zebra]|uniref:prosalusin-like isoform X2 n=1 Tax=Maylandia zebra TaxID=106582 RepID=UPI00403C3AD6
MMLTLGQFVLWASLRCNTCKMKPRKQHVLLLWILLSSTVIKETEPFSSFKFPNIKETWNSIWGESCNSYWISFNQTGLKADLGNKLFGQHIASNTIFKSVSGFMKDNNPKKPLVLSLHGPTGTGKNFVSQLIADNVYKKGYHSKFVHVFSATHHFPHRSEIVTYKSQLQESIKNSVTNCERSMFIFDEMDKIPPGVIDSIKPYLDYGKVEGVFFQRSIIIFLRSGIRCHLSRDFSGHPRYGGLSPPTTPPASGRRSQTLVHWWFFVFGDGRPGTHQLTPGGCLSGPGAWGSLGPLRRWGAPGLSAWGSVTLAQLAAGGAHGHVTATPSGFCSAAAE